MRYLSVCSGIEAASVAWRPLGWSPLAFAETEAFPKAVLHHHYPDVPNWGDINRHKEWPDAAIDVLVGGTPCQPFSVAGLRKGLDDPRGNLTLVYLAIADQYRPRWLVWENVPGLLSINEGRVFSAFIGGLAELGYHASWRVLDAQYVRVDGLERAVPQRRRRLFVIGHSADWRCPAAVLFERESLCGDHPPRREAGQDASAPLGGSAQEGGYRTTDLDFGAFVAKSLKSSDGGIDREDGHTLIAGAVSHKWHKQSGGPAGDECYNLVAFDPTQITSPDNRSQPDDRSPQLTESGQPPAIANTSTVRRLTPLECERLMGLPDGYTLVPYRGNALAKDGPRYKALGNSMAVNCIRWIGQRIALVDEMT